MVNLLNLLQLVIFIYLFRFLRFRAIYFIFRFEDDWQIREKNLKASDIVFKSPDQDLIDLIWPADERPQKPNSQIKIHDVKYAGKI